MIDPKVKRLIQLLAIGIAVYLLLVIAQIMANQ